MKKTTDVKNIEDIQVFNIMGKDCVLSYQICKFLGFSNGTSLTKFLISYDCITVFKIGTYHYIPLDELKNHFSNIGMYWIKNIRFKNSKQFIYDAETNRPEDVSKTKELIFRLTSEKLKEDILKIKQESRLQNLLDFTENKIKVYLFRRELTIEGINNLSEELKEKVALYVQNNYEILKQELFNERNKKKETKNPGQKT